MALRGNLHFRAGVLGHNTALLQTFSPGPSAKGASGLAAHQSGKKTKKVGTFLIDESQTATSCQGILVTHLSDQTLLLSKKKPNVDHKKKKQLEHFHLASTEAWEKGVTV